MLIHYSCRHYRGDVPCLPNKERGRECPTCEEFDPITDRIALIKLGAPGDVLRTTSLLPGIRRHWPGCEITWLTRLDSAPLLQNIGLDRILTLEEEGVLQMLGEKFDVVINLDNDPLAAAWQPRNVLCGIWDLFWMTRGGLSGIAPRRSNGWRWPVLTV